MDKDPANKIRVQFESTAVPVAKSNTVSDESCMLVMLFNIRICTADNLTQKQLEMIFLAHQYC